MPQLVTDLVQIDRLGTKKVAENERFRKHMKRHNFSDLRFRRVAEEIEEKIDCRTCANCCKVAETDITARDAARIARYMGMTEKQFVEKYTTTSAFEDSLILRRTESGCVFLNGNDCTIYEERPDTCRNFPHLVRGRGSIESRMWQMIDRATYCPIVYNTLEEYKDLMHFQRDGGK